MARAAKEENDIYDLLFFDVAPVTLGLAIYLAVFKRGKRKKDLFHLLLLFSCNHTIYSALLDTSSVYTCHKNSIIRGEITLLIAAVASCPGRLTIDILYIAFQLMVKLLVV